MNNSFVKSPELDLNFDILFTTKQELCISRAIAIVDEALSRFGPDALSLSFNGGKDCTVMLYIYAAVLEKFYRTTGQQRRPIRCLYIIGADPFEQVNTFVSVCSERFNLNVETYQCNMKDGLGIFLKSNPTTKAIFIGTRNTDPYSSDITAFQMTDGDWPRVMRIHALFDWTYKEIWRAILSLHIPYCILYDQGYTSLGNISDTQKNPTLRISNDDYKPAYLLEDDSRERDGRVKRTAQILKT